jgi:bis(5'-nucleosyl)-tetraphosphatase (symmetrical)
MDRMVVAVGDIHGCLEEFDELLRLISYNKNQMRLVLLGDLMDRGPDPIGCVRRARELGVECIMGNHEEKHLRWLKHEKKRLETGKANPMKPMAPAESKANQELSDQDFTWMKNLPLKMHLVKQWWAVHGGCEPRYSLEKQNPAQVMRVRYVNESGAGMPLNSDKSQPEGTVYWAEKWTGPESIVYGHCVHDLQQVRLDQKDAVQCLGIDTGCCFGGHLTAVMFDEVLQGQPDGTTVATGTFHLELAQVKAKQKYYHGYGEE